MHRIKSLISMVVTLCIIFSFTACGNSAAQTSEEIQDKSITEESIFVALGAKFEICTPSEENGAEIILSDDKVLETLDDSQPMSRVYLAKGTGSTSVIN